MVSVAGKSAVTIEDGILGRANDYVGDRATGGSTSTRRQLIIVNATDFNSDVTVSNGRRGAPQAEGRADWAGRFRAWRSGGSGDWWKWSQRGGIGLGAAPGGLS